MACPGDRGAADLPAELTSFVGRDEELAAAERLLGAQARLVTLVGPGGVGKTRIALRAARRLLGQFPDGLCLVELSALRDAELLPNTVAAALRLPEQSGLPALDLLVEYLKSKELLLILDTCEHVVDACAMLSDVLLRAAPRLRIMATSRQALSVPGEYVLEVPPLGVPDEGNGAQETDAVRLFAERAAAVRRGFTVDEGNRAAVGALCRRLDGIPLAIELATVRLRALSLEQLVDRLDGRFRLLTGGNRTALSRHQTLRTTIGWSHELCSPEERLLWARLSVFAGPFELAAVEEVCADAALPADEILEPLIGLVDKSVVVRMDDESGTHYRLLDTIREYGEEWLDGSGDTRRMRVRHLEYCLALVREFDEIFCTSEQLPGYLRLRRSSADLRAALEYCFAGGETEDARTGLRLAVSLWGFWLCSSRYTEGRYWLDKGLALVGDASPERAGALRFSGWFAIMQGEHDAGVPLFEESLRIAEDLADESLVTYALQYLGGTCLFKGDGERALRYYGEARRRLVEQEDHVGIVIVHYQEALMHAMLGDTRTAIELCDVSLRLLAGTDECWNTAWALWVKGTALWLGGEHEGCEDVLRAALELKHRLLDTVGMAHCLEALAWTAAERGDFERTAWTLGASSALYEKIGAPLFGITMLQGHHDEAERTAQEALGAARYGEVFRGGFAAPLDAAVVCALRVGEVPPLPGCGARPSSAAESALDQHQLTLREREVAELVAAGLTNRQIADRLIISKRTVDAHVEHILNKLGCSSRTGIGDRLGEVQPAPAHGEVASSN